jgi:hypothetical protein
LPEKKRKSKARRAFEKFSPDRHIAKRRCDEKPLFHWIYFDVVGFARKPRAMPAQIVFASRFALRRTCLDDRIASAYTHGALESLFFSLRWCKRIAVQVDPRPH